MALIYCTGFDYSTTVSHYNIIGPSNIYIDSGGRTGNRLRIHNAGAGGFARLDLINNYSEIVCGFAIQLSNFNNNNMFFSIENSDNVFSLGLISKNDGYLRVTIRNQINYDTSFLFTRNLWYYIEVKLKISSTAGYFIVKINNVVVEERYNLDTRPSTTNPFIRYFLFNVSANAGDNTLIDDLYVCTTTGSKNNDFLGDVKVVTLFPTRNGSYNEFNVVGASSQYLAVNETSPNSDTNYVTQSGIGLQQTFGFTAPSISGSILGLKVNHFMRKDDAGSRFVKLLGIYSSNSDLSDSISLLDSYRYYNKIYESRIGSTEDWSINDLNSVEFGVRIVES